MMTKKRKRNSQPERSFLFIHKEGKKIGYHLMSWVFGAVMVYIAVSTFFLILFQPNFIEDIIKYSIGGFWGFFLGYFGYRLGETLERYFLRR
jgi:hypothetical protein